jgi:predicted CXXCH cytochrome family protein
LLLVSAGGVLLYSQVGKKHPRLKNTEEATCLRCHKSVKLPKGLHGALELSDCLSCHEVHPTMDNRTIVSLKERGKGLCLGCHDDIAGRLDEETPHKALLQERECLSCHRPHSSPYGNLLDQEDVQALCLSCHENIAKALRSSHPHAAVEMGGCPTCHDSHASTHGKLLTDSVPSLCIACHDVDAALKARHAGMDVSREVCTACHDPHGSNVPGMLLAGSAHPPFAEKMCESCHAEDRAPMPALCTACHDDIEGALRAGVEHMPASDDCTLCHNPHASREGKLLKQAMPGICMDCHDSGEKAFRDRHGGLVPQKCSLCHNPHGSREQGLLAGSRRHAPFKEGKCKSCHYGSGKRGKVSLLFKSNRLCLRCHEEIEPETKLPVVHAALDEGCTVCHDPHVSERDHLLRSEQGELCGSCHDIEDAGLLERHAGSNLSAAVCIECHAPHGSANEALLPGKAVHSPFGERMCEACHAGRDGRGRTAFVESGKAMCVACHDDVEAQTGKKFPHAAAEDCTFCHTPHAGREAHLLRRPLPRICGECHDVKDDDLRAGHGGFDISGAACTTCHAPHGSDAESLFKASNNHAPFEGRMCDSCHEQGEGGTLTLMEEGNGLCLMCHSEVTEGKPAALLHSAIPEEGCTACHDPHLAPHPKLLPASGEALCFRCHEDIEKLTKQKFPHGALDMEGCVTCHASSHATENENLLADSLPSLCTMCHDADDLKEAHAGHPVGDARCTRCHDPHASSESKLVRPLAHPPFAERMCEGCHDEPREGRVTYQMEGNDLCYACHTDKEEQVSNMPMVHGAVEAAGCAGCHEPHTSSSERLLLEPMPGLCLACHDDVLSNGPTVHGAVERWGCALCHEPHGTKASKLLHAEVNVLCRTCHAGGRRDDVVASALGIDEAERATFRKIRLRGDLDHPRQNHPVKGSFEPDVGLKNLEPIDLSCVSCHNPHSGADRRLFVGGLDDEMALCATCHIK